MGLFVKRYHKYIKKNGVKHSDNNLINFIRQANSSNKDDNNKGKSKSSCFNYVKVKHYKSDCPQLKKDKDKGQYRKSSKPRRACIAWESDSESSSEGSSSESDGKANFCLMAHHHKKKNLSYSKYEPNDEMSYYELQISFENLYGEVVDVFKRLTSNKRFFSYLETKVLETEKQMEALSNSC